jgi:hypothetical protein
VVVGEVMVGLQVLILVESVEVVMVLQVVVMPEKQILEVVEEELEIKGAEGTVVRMSLLFVINSRLSPIRSDGLVIDTTRDTERVFTYFSTGDTIKILERKGGALLYYMNITHI